MREYAALSFAGIFMKILIFDSPWYCGVDDNVSIASRCSGVSFGCLPSIRPPIRPHLILVSALGKCWARTVFPTVRSCSKNLRFVMVCRLFPPFSAACVRRAHLRRSRRTQTGVRLRDLTA